MCVAVVNPWNARNGRNVHLQGVAALLGVLVDVQDREALDQVHQASLPLPVVAVDQQIARPSDELSFLSTNRTCV
jgi:hypothetical protein